MFCCKGEPVFQRFPRDSYLAGSSLFAQVLVRTRKSVDSSSRFLDCATTIARMLARADDCYRQDVSAHSSSQRALAVAVISFRASQDFAGR